MQMEEGREDKLSKDELAQLLKQRKECAAIIGQTRVRGEIECMNVHVVFWWEERWLGVI